MECRTARFSSAAARSTAIIIHHRDSGDFEPTAHAPSTLEEQLALACVARESCRVLELPTCFVVPAHFGEKITAHAR
jgi:hypothetical protein